MASSVKGKTQFFQKIQWKTIVNDSTKEETGIEKKGREITFPFRNAEQQ